jgi:toxin ParE1/3/4
LKLRWVSAARDLLSRQLAFVAEDNPTAAKRLRVRIHDAVRKLRQFPECGRTGEREGTRELVVPGLPYIIVYHIRNDTVFILRVFHSGTNWQESQI